MFVYRIASLNSTIMANLWAYRIDDTKECKEFLKYHYDFDVEECHLGKWFICSKHAEWTCDTDVFPLNYRIQDISNIIPIDYEGDAAECECSSENTARIRHQSLPKSINVNCSEVFGFSMDVVFED